MSNNPESQRWTPPFKRGGIFIEALTKSKKPKPCNRPAAYRPPTNNEAKGNNVEVTFLTLPVEIRLQIYNLLLVSRSNDWRGRSWSVGNTDQRKVFLSMERNPKYRTMEPAILQTCKQIYHEANPILYSQNVFAIARPEEIFRLMLQIGLVKFKLIKKLDIWVPWMADLSPWLRLLHILVEEASGLRYLKLKWCAGFMENPRKFERRVLERGLGDQLDFVRALGKIQGLETLVIDGYYAKNWPAYLEERMGVRVQTIDQWLDEMRLRGDLEDRIQYICDINEQYLQDLREYQQGTEELIP
jgi:hypothetical protein